MDKKFWGKCICSLVVAVVGFVFAFAVFYVSLKIDQVYTQKVEEALDNRIDLSTTRFWAILSVTVDLVAGVPFVITVFVAELILKKKGHSSTGRRLVTLAGSGLFILLMAFLFKMLTGLDQMYPLIPTREMAYEIMIMLTQVFSCVPAVIIMILTLIALLTGLGKKKQKSG